MPTSPVIPRIICAPMAGGPSTPALVAAVGEAGALGFLAAGYRTPHEVAREIRDVRSRSDAPFGVNIFCYDEVAVDKRELARYIQSLTSDAQRVGVQLGAPTFDDDSFREKLQVVLDARVPHVSFTFGFPPPHVVDELRERGMTIWGTVATVDDAAIATGRGADVLVVQGREAGGHRATYVDDGGQDALATIELISRLSDVSAAPLVAAGGMATAADVRAALVAGAVAAQAGTAFLRAHEAGTSAIHREALSSSAPTAYTRAFSGRTARGISNAFVRRHVEVPCAYPQIHHVTAPMRAAARAAGNVDLINLWAGERYHLAQSAAAADIVPALMIEVDRAPNS